MITNLTSKQEAAIQAYLKEGMGLGLGTDQINWDDADVLVGEVYKQILNLPKPIVITVNSPKKGMRVVNYLQSLSEDNFIKLIQDKSNGLELLSHVEGEIVNSNKYNNYNSNYIWGCQDLYWVQFYRFINNELPVNQFPKEKLEAYFNLISKTGWIFPFEKVCVVTRKPIALRLEDRPRREGEARRLHSFDQPAIEWDDYKCYFIAGVPVPEDIITTPANEIPVERFFSEQNAEVRLAIGAKIGMERLHEKMGGKVLDTIYLKDYSPILRDFESREEPLPDWAVHKETGLINPFAIAYQLLDIEIRPGFTARYLKMGNVSESKIHLEVVDSSCQTVREALAWREGTPINMYVDPQWIA